MKADFEKSAVWYFKSTENFNLKKKRWFNPCGILVGTISTNPKLEKMLPTTSQALLVSNQFLVLVLETPQSSSC